MTDINKNLIDLFPTIKDDDISSDDAMDFFIKVTNDINESTEERTKLYENTFGKKFIFVTYALIAINVIIFVFGFLIYIPNKFFGECLCEICGCCGCCCCDKSDRKSYENCADYCGSICLVLIVFIFLITNIIIFSILCSKYNTDDTENFLSFLQCKNINKEAFEKYLVLNDLSSHISLLKSFQSIFIVLDFIFLIMSLILKCCFFRQQ